MYSWNILLDYDHHIVLYHMASKKSDPFHIAQVKPNNFWSLLISSWVLASIILGTFHGALSPGVQYIGYNLFVMILIVLMFHNFNNFN